MVSLVVERAIAERIDIGDDRRHQRREGLHDLRFADAPPVEPPGVRGGFAFEQIVEHQPEFLRELANAHVAGVDQLATEFDHLPVREMVAQAEHAAADARLRFVDARRHAGLAQAPRGAEARDARADDDDFGFARGVCA